MTCAACAARIEKALNKLDGVDATVNFATEQAAVRFDEGEVAIDELLRAVEGSGLPCRAHALRERARRRARPPPRGCDGADRPPRAHRDGPAAPVRGLGVGGVRARHPGVGVGGLAVPPGGASQPPPRRGDHGHPHLARDDRRVRLVARRPRGARRRGDLLRGRRRDHDSDPPGPLARVESAPTVRRRHPGAARARRQGRPCPARRGRDPRAGGGAGGRRPLRRPPRREGGHRRRRRRGSLRGRPFASDRGTGARGCRAR